MSNKIEEPTILVIFGITGDLASRYLLPAIGKIAKASALPKEFRIVGVSRRPIEKADIVPKAYHKELDDHLEIYQMDMTDQAAYHKLATHLKQIEKNLGGAAQHLFHLSLPSPVTLPVVGMLGEAGLLTSPQAKLLLEKPFGSDLASAEELVTKLTKYCQEEQIYRIDHFMAKEMSQNIVIFRGCNSLFQHTWNKDFVESIHITGAEAIGIEGRAAFYEQTGALRDYVQNHLLQLAALVLMELPKVLDWQTIPARRQRALEALQAPSDVAGQVHRGQYQGYREEVKNPHSQVETYVSMCLYSNDPVWEGVPIILTTGKRMDADRVEIRLRYRQDDGGPSNELILHVQPNEGVTFHVWVKQPGYDQEVKQLPLQLAYGHHFAELPGAYERVFVDAMRSDRALFTTSDEVLAAWRLLAPIQQAWNMSDKDLFVYEPGSSLEQ